jgi:hypothetical protein
MSAFRVLSSVAVVTATAACAAAPRSAEVPPVSGCYALHVPDWYGAVSAATGLRSLPSYVKLDATPNGVRGRRILLPATWQEGGSNPAWASWRVEGRYLVLSFLGSAGTLEMALRRTVDGYTGETVTPFPRGLPPVHVTLAASSCVGLRAGAD